MLERQDEVSREFGVGLVDLRIISIEVVIKSKGADKINRRKAYQGEMSDLHC